MTDWTVHELLAEQHRIARILPATEPWDRAPLEDRQAAIAAELRIRTLT